MTQYYTLNVNLSNSQYNKLESRIKSATEVNLNFSSNFFEVSRLCKVFENGSSANRNYQNLVA